MSLPTRLEAENVTWYFAIAQFVCQRQNALLGRVSFISVPEAEAPLRRHMAAPGKHVVALDGIQHVGTGEEIDVNTGRVRHINNDGTGIAIPDRVRVVRIWVGSPARSRRSLRRLRPRIAKVECRVSSGVDQDPYPSVVT